MMVQGGTLVQGENWLPVPRQALWQCQWASDCGNLKEIMIMIRQHLP